MSLAMELASWVQHPVKAVSISHSANTLGNIKNLTILSPAMGK